MSDRPLIGIAWPRPDYVASVERAGGRVRELTPGDDPLPAALDGCDGVVLTGGADVDPVAYGEDRHPTVELDLKRDAYELALAKLALARNIPLFAICRGAQVLNVAAGGTLIQDIPSQHPTELTHSMNNIKDGTVHDVVVAPNTCLSVLLDGQLHEGRYAVNSRHHQSVKKAAPGFVVSATAPDGVIEAIEKPDASFCLGVQWHPENFWKSGRFGTLFTGLVEAAQRFRAKRESSL